MLSLALLLEINAHFQTFFKVSVRVVAHLVLISIKKTPDGRNQE